MLKYRYSQTCFYVTFQEDNGIGSLNTCLIDMKCTVKGN